MILRWHRLIIGFNIRSVKIKFNAKKKQTVT